MNKGIITLAIKNPYYGRMAYNLAATIKAGNKDFPVAIIADADGLSHISSIQARLFDKIIPYETTDLSGVRPKLEIDLLSPFDETIFIDADACFLFKNDPVDLFNEIPGDAFFSAITEGRYDVTNNKSENDKKYTFWADPKSIAEAYNISDGFIYQFRSELMYMKKGEELTKMMNFARDVYANPLVSYMNFVGGIPDELAINISAAVNKIDPHVYQWSPSFWTGLHGIRIPEMGKMKEDGYYILSCGGGSSSSPLKKYYNRIVGAAMNRLGIQHVFPLMPKRDFIKERKTF